MNSSSIHVPPVLLPDGLSAGCRCSHTQRATGHSFVLWLSLWPVGLDSQTFGPDANFFAPPSEEECPPRERIHSGTAGSVAADGTGADGLSWRSSCHRLAFHRGLQSSCAACSGKQSCCCQATLIYASFAIAFVIFLFYE